MSVSNTLTLGWSSGSANGVNQSVTLSANTSVISNFTGTNSATTQVHLDWTNANLQVFYALSDQDLTLKTNSSGSPQDTITLHANKPFVWYKNSGITNPFAGNVTTTYWTNGGLVDANVQVRILTDD
jgi:hypothetical protein